MEAFLGLRLRRRFFFCCCSSCAPLVESLGCASFFAACVEVPLAWRLVSRLLRLAGAVSLSLCCVPKKDKGVSRSSHRYSSADCSKETSAIGSALGRCRRVDG